VPAFCGVAAGFSGGCCHALRSVLTVFFFCRLGAVTAPALAPSVFRFLLAVFLLRLEADGCFCSASMVAVCFGFGFCYLL